MLATTLERALRAFVGFVVLGVVAPEARSSETEPLDGSTVTADRLVKDYRAALLRNVTLRIVAGPDGAQPTVERAIWQICRQAGVPYQTERSRRAGAQVGAAAAYTTFNGVVASDAIHAICGRAGLTPELDAQGVYLVAAPPPARGADPSAPAGEGQAQTTDATAPSRPLSTLDRAQIGAALNVTANLALQKDTKKWERESGSYEEELLTQTEQTTQQIQLRMALISTKDLGQLRVAVTIFGRDRVLIPNGDWHSMPVFRAKSSFVRLHEETLDVGDLPHGQQRTGATSLVTAVSFETRYRLTRRWRENDRIRTHTNWSKTYSSGKEYCAWIVDVYCGEYLIKVAASSRGLFKELNRDPTTGFPLQ